MLFNIEHDSPDCIIGYLVPDGYSAESKLKVCANGRELLELATFDARPALVAAGRHETGKCGFILDSTILPGIDKIPDLEIFDAASNLLIYRRPKHDFIKKKVLRIDTHLFPLRKLDVSMCRFFQHYASRVERFGKETIDQLFLLNRADSIFLSGRILYRNFQHYIDGQFSIFIILQDPYEELAERILTLKILSTSDRKVLGERDEIHFGPAIAYVEKFPLTDTTNLKRCISNMPREVITILSNPVVRQLTASSSDEMPQRFSVASALDVLSSCELVGFRHEPTAINQIVADVLKLNPVDIGIQEQIPSVRTVGAMLRDLGNADDFLEKDIELYQNALQAAKIVERSSGNFHDER